MEGADGDVVDVPGGSGGGPRDGVVVRRGLRVGYRGPGPAVVRRCVSLAEVVETRLGVVRRAPEPFPIYLVQVVRF